MDFIKHLTHILLLKENWEKESFALYRSITDKGQNYNVLGAPEMKEKYFQIFGKYCAENIKPGGGSFSPTPKLAVDNVTITVIEENKSKVICKVQPKNSSYYFTFRFKMLKEEWLIDKIALVGVDGKETKSPF